MKSRKVLSDSERNIIFFDDWCHICSFWVRAVLLFDKKRNFFFSPLQGSTAQNLIPKEAKRADAVVLWQKGNITFGMEAILKITDLLGFPFNILKVLKLTPKSWREKLYNIVASNRFRLFGKRKTCMRPKNNFMDRFLLD